MALTVLPGAASAADKKPSALVLAKEFAAQLDASTPKNERNVVPRGGTDPEAEDYMSDDDYKALVAQRKKEFFPVISFEGSQAQGKKVVYTVNHENLGPPSFSSIEYMWIKDEKSGEIITAKKFRANDPNLVITGFGSAGQKLTAGAKDDKFGIWQGTFIVP